MRKYQRVAVVKGGWSPEREVSLSTGTAAAKALVEAGYDVFEIDATSDLPFQLKEASPDVVFNALHGQWGEDGCVQGLLELMETPYTHSGVLASSLAMDKQRAKLVFDKMGIPAPLGKIVLREMAASGSVMAPPYVVKPNNQGSSVGVFVVREGDNRPADALLDPKWNLGEEVLVEKFIPGRELTVAVMGGKPLCVTEIKSATDFYDFEAKYADGGSHHILPAKLPDAVTDRAMELARLAHLSLGCKGLSRADFRYDAEAEGETLYCLEVNTQPGLTSTSLAPEQAAHLGMSFRELCTWIVEDASCQR